MAWVILLIAGAFEVAMTSCLGKCKDAEGMTLALWIAAFIVCACISMGLLAKATQTLPLGTAYAVWTGIGAIGTVVVGILWFKEPAGVARLFFLGTLIASIIGLKLVSH